MQSFYCQVINVLVILSYETSRKYEQKKDHHFNMCAT